MESNSFNTCHHQPSSNVSEVKTNQKLGSTNNANTEINHSHSSNVQLCIPNGGNSVMQTGNRPDNISNEDKERSNNTTEVNWETCNSEQCNCNVDGDPCESEFKTKSKHKHIPTDNNLSVSPRSRKSSVPRGGVHLCSLGYSVGDSVNPRKIACITGDSIEYLEQSVDGPQSVLAIQTAKANEVANGEETSNESAEKSGFWLKKFSKKQIMTLLSLCIVDFTASMGMSIMAPFFPMEAAQKGMDEALVGFVFSCYALVMFIMSPIFGRVLPKLGPHFVFFSGLFLSAGCTILFGTLDYMDGTTFTIFCFIVRSFEALGAAAFNTASCTIIAQIFPDNVSAVFGLLETFVGLGMSMGPAVGGALYSVNPDGNFGLPFYVLGSFMAIMVPFNIWLLPTENVSNIHVRSGSLFRLVGTPIVIVMGSVTIVQACAWSFLDPFLQPHLNQFNLTSEMVGLVFLMLSATYGIFCPLFGWMADKWDHTSIMMIIGMILTSSSLLLIGPSHFFPFLPSTLELNIVALILLGIATPLAEIPTFQSMMDYAMDSGFDDDIGTYSLVSGIWSAAFSFGEFLGPSLGGLLMNNYDFADTSSVLAAIILIPAFMLIIYEIHSCQKQKKLQQCGSTSEKIVPVIATEETPLLKSV